MLGGLTMCEVSVDDGEQRSEQNEGDTNRCDDRNDKAENWVQNEMTDGHKKLEQKMGHRLVFKLDSEQADGWSQHLEQKLARRLGAKQIDESQHRVSWPWESDRTEDADKSRLESTRQRAQWCQQGIQQHDGTDVTGTRKPEYSTRRLASLLRGTRVDACLCPKIQKANS